MGEREGTSTGINADHLMLGVIADAMVLHQLPDGGGDGGPGDAHGSRFGCVEVELGQCSLPMAPEPRLDQHGRLVGGSGALVGRGGREDGHPSGSMDFSAPRIADAPLRS
jgi:hypothetical protein